jgi:hypothetical protein
MSDRPKEKERARPNDDSGGNIGHSLEDEDSG